MKFYRVLSLFKLAFLLGVFGLTLSSNSYAETNAFCQDIKNRNPQGMQRPTVFEVFGQGGSIRYFNVTIKPDSAACGGFYGICASGWSCTEVKANDGSGLMGSCCAQKN